MRYSISIGSPTPPEKSSLCCSLWILSLCGYSVLTNDTAPNETVENTQSPGGGDRFVLRRESKASAPYFCRRSAAFSFFLTLILGLTPQAMYLSPLRGSRSHDNFSSGLDRTGWAGVRRSKPDPEAPQRTRWSVRGSPRRARLRRARTSLSTRRTPPWWRTTRRAREFFRRI